MVVEPLLLPWDCARPLSRAERGYSSYTFSAQFRHEMDNCCTGVRQAARPEIRAHVSRGACVQAGRRPNAMGLSRDHEEGRQGAAMGDVISLEQRRSARLAMAEGQRARLKVTFFFDLASPFTYLAAER